MMSSEHVLYLLVEYLNTPIPVPPCGDQPPGLKPFEWEIDSSNLVLPGWLHWGFGSCCSGSLPSCRFRSPGRDSSCATARPRSSTPTRCSCSRNSRRAEQFIARVDWSVPATGASGQGTPTVLSSDSGYFTFFDTGNVEVTIKVLDGRSINGHWWLFVASQTHLPFTLTLVRGFECALSAFPGASCEVLEFAHQEGPPQNLVDIEAFAAAGP